MSARPLSVLLRSCIPVCAALCLAAISPGLLRAESWGYGAAGGFQDPQVYGFSLYDQTLNGSAVVRAVAIKPTPGGPKNGISVYHFFNAQWDATRANVMTTAFLCTPGVVIAPGALRGATSLDCGVGLSCYCPASGPDDDYVGLVLMQGGVLYASPLIAETSGTSIIGGKAFGAKFPLVPGVFSPLGGPSAPPLDLSDAGGPITLGVWIMSRVTAGHGGWWPHDSSFEIYEVWAEGADYPAPVPPVITTHPGSVTPGVAGIRSFRAATEAALSPAVFSCRATGSGNPDFPTSYNWERRAAGSSEWVELSGASPYVGVTTGDLSVSEPTLAMDGDQFRCRVSNIAGTVYSNSAELITNLSRTPPTFTTQAVDLATTPPLGATFRAVAGGVPAPRYQWQRLAVGSGVWSNLANDAVYSGTTSTTLTLASTTLGMVGDQFRCVAANGATPDAVSDVVSLQALMVYPTTKELGFGAARYSVAVHTAGAWSVENSADWVTITRGAWTTTGNFDVAVAPNTTAADRSAVLRIGGATHTITQRANGTSLLELYGVGEDLYGQLGISTVTRASFEKMGTGIKAVAAGGGGQTFVVTTDGVLWGCGGNAYGQLGDGSTTQRTVPVQIATSVASVAAGEMHTLFVKTDGTLWAMGYGAYGQLGLGSTGNRTTPVQVATGVARASAGSIWSMFIKTDGTLWAMGYNGSGQLGDGTTTQRNTPVQVATGVASVAAGGSHNLFVKTDGTLWAMGGNGSGQLGDGSTSQRNTPVQIASNVTQAVGGALSSAFAKGDGTLWTMGDNSYGQLGRGSLTPSSSSTPSQVATGVAAAPGLAAGWAHVMYLKTDGSLWAFGNGEFGQIGDGSFVDRSAPVQVTTGVSSVATGLYHSVALKTDGSWWVTGANGSGQAGDGTVSQRPTRVEIATRVVAAASGAHHSLYLKNDGTLWAAGDNRYGQLGDGTSTRRSTPVQIAAGVASMSAGLLHSTYVANDGRLYVFGQGIYGQLGLAGAPAWSTPQVLASSVLTASAGDYHTLFVKTDGTVWATGYNVYGELGDGGVTQWRAYPAQVATDATAVSCGKLHSLVLKADGFLWAAGANSSGQLGDGTTTQRAAFVRVATGVASISAGEYHSLFVKTDGSLWAMGANTYGQLGDGSRTQRPTPVQVATGVTKASAGSICSMFIKTDGTLWAMGSYPYGALGSEVYSEKATPTLVTDGVSYVAARGSLFFIRNAAAPGAITAPVVNTQPVDASTPVGSGSMFSVAASGTPSPVYQWQRKAVGDAQWIDLANTVRFSGTGSGTLTITDTTMAMNGDQFRCVVSNGGTQDIISSVATLTVTKAPATVQLNYLTQTYDGFPKYVTASTTPEGLAVELRYELVVQPGVGSATPPTNAGNYVAIATIVDDSYQGTRGEYFTITKATAIVNVSDSTHLYDGTPKSIRVSTIPEGLTTAVTYSGQATGPSSVGVHPAEISVVDTNYTYAGTADVVIQPAVSLGQTGIVASTAGGLTTLTASAGGGTNVTYQWQMLPETGLAAARTASLRPADASGSALTGWIDIPGATGASYTLPSVQTFHSGTYRVFVTVNGAPAVSSTFVVQVDAAPASNARVMNLSTRALDLTGDNLLIPGFVISGTGTKRILVRAVGPGLFDTFGLQGYLADPQLTLRNQDTGAQIAANDDWGTSPDKTAIITTSQSVGAFPLLESSKDSVLVVDLPAGHYTAPAVGAAGGTGIAMVELYDADPDNTGGARLVNISNRGFVDVGDKIMIPGFVVSNEGSRTFLIRAVGPGLRSTFGLQGILEDPVLTVFNSAGQPILSNDNWDGIPGSTTTSSTAAQVGAFPLVAGSTDAAFVVTLPPGGYTIQATGKASTTGVALVEVYVVP